MRRSRKSCAMVVMVFAILGGLFTVPRVHAQSWDNGGADSNWGTPENWVGDVEPTAGGGAAVVGYDKYDANAYAVVTESGEAATSLFMGRGAATGTLVITSGDLTVGEMLIGYTTGGAGHIIQSNGTVNQTSPAKFRLGSAAGSFGSYVLEDGTLNVEGNAIVGQLGNGVLECRGGNLVTSGGGDLNIGNAAGSTGRVVLAAGGNISHRYLYVGTSGNGTFTQTGGTNVESIIFLAGNAGGNGTYALTGGSLVATNLYLDDGTSRFEQTNGTTVEVISNFRLGVNNTAADAVYTMRGGTLNLQCDFDAPYLLAAHSELRGWGTVNVTNAGKVFELKTANAFVRADGFGEDHELDVNYLTLQTSDPNDPTTRNGWYAVNHGELTLPDVNVTADTVYWGEDSAASSPNRANSVKLDFTGRSGSGTLTGSLLAPDHGTVPPFMAAKNLVAGVWRFDLSGITFENTGLTFRYDPEMVAELGLLESEVEVYRHTGGPEGAWTKLPGPSRDEINNRITAPTANGLGFFAVGKLVPPQGTLFLVR